jgi:hypothetical protein
MLDDSPAAGHVDETGADYQKIERAQDALKKIQNIMYKTEDGFEAPDDNGSLAAEAA